MQPLRKRFGRLQRKSLECVRPEVAALLLPLARLLQNPVTRRHKEERYTVRLAAPVWAHVIRQAAEGMFVLAAECEPGFLPAAGGVEENQIVAVANRSVEPVGPPGPEQSLGDHPLLDLAHRGLKLHRLRIIRSQLLLQPSFEPEVPAVEHHWIDI